MNIYVLVKPETRFRQHMFPLLKPFYKEETLDEEQLNKIYQISINEFSFVKNIGDAKIAILPMSWDYYIKNKKKNEAIQLINSIKEYNLKIWSFTTGDFGVKTPSLNNLIVFRTSGERTKFKSNHKGYPALIQDPLRVIYNTNTLKTREYSVIPKIGFCGQTNESLLNSFKEIARVCIRNVKYYLGLSFDLPQKIQSTSYLRSSVLKIIKKSERLQANFIERKKYRAGALTNEKRKKTTLEFYNNMVESDYMVTIRGGGNFSIRFYEALAMGRIPVFINTDCILPLEDKIDWKKHVVWIEESEINSIEEKIVQFHTKLTPDTFKDLQQSNRKLWEDKLTLGGFFKTFDYE